MQTRQSDKAFVVDILVQITFGTFDECTDLLQTLQIPNGTGEEQTEDHIHIVDKSFTTFLLIAYEVEHHVCFIVTNGDGHVAFMDNTQWHSGIGRPGPYLLDIGNTEDNQHPTVVVLIAGTLIGIADIAYKIIRDVEFLFQLLPVFIGWTGDLYPTIWLPLLEWCQVAIGVPECLHFC